MRFLISLPALAAILPMVASAQQPPAPNPIPAPLRAAFTAINGDLNGNGRRYQTENAATKPPAPGEQRVVFMGDSITDNMHNAQRFGPFFPGRPYLNRGIGGQTTAQMVMRFYPDVIALQPAAVVIFAGTNDIAGNLGPVPLDAIEQNLASMALMAKGAGIKVVMASVTPICDLPGRPPMSAGRPPDTIQKLNSWIKDFAATHGAVYLDYFSVTADEKGLLKAEMTEDGLHPTIKGYEVMNPLAEKAIAQALGK